MANEEHLAILRRGVVAWESWWEANRQVQPDLSGADLHTANLSGANLRGADLNKANLREAHLGFADLRAANLCGADLRGAYMSGVNLSSADLSDVNLRGADLGEANLSGANLGSADLRKAYLREANLRGANLRDVNLGETRLSGTVLTNTDLSEVRGIETVVHQGPSSLGIDTLVMSKGKIPKSFLQGCGVPDSFIEYLPALLGAMQPIQFYSCFISHSTKDQDFTQRLYERMQSYRLRVWFAPEDMKGGAKLHEQIDQAIRIHDKLVLILSEHSIQSEWVMTEIRKARKAELRDGRRKLFPIRLVDMDTLRDWECFDADTGKDLAVEVREYFIPDFTRWKDHDSFERAFARFLKDLQATEAPPVPRAVEDPKVSSEPLRSGIDYNLGLERLRAMVKDTPAQSEFATLEARLLGVLNEEHLYGVTETTRAGKAQVVHSLNQLMSENRLEASFTDLCRP